MTLSKEQILLLNSLLYIDGGGFPGNPLIRADAFEGQTVRNWLDSMDVGMLEDQLDYGSFITGRKWKKILHAIRRDDILMDMTITATHTDSVEKGGGNGFSAVFTDSESKTAVFVFRGTASHEWGDNFKGGNLTDTRFQKNALAWYQKLYKDLQLDSYTIIVTGHSKGGNKSKYITVMDDSVDRCLSFDGQGFSDKFVAEYEDRITLNRHKIENHNAEYDYVHILLNDIGNTAYYIGQDIGKGGFLENHCPNTLMYIDEEGTVHMDTAPEGQAKEMKTLMLFLNNHLRSIPEDKRNTTLAMVNTLLDDALSAINTSSTAFINGMMDTITVSRYSRHMAYLLASLIKHGQKNPEAMADIKNILRKFRMASFVNYVDVTDKLLNFDISIANTHLNFPVILGLVSGAGDFIASSKTALSLLSKWLKETQQIHLDSIQLKELVEMGQMVDEYLRHITKADIEETLTAESLLTASDSNMSSPEGQAPVRDSNVPSPEDQAPARDDTASKKHTFLPGVGTLKLGSEELKKISIKLLQYAEEVEAQAKQVESQIIHSPRIEKTIQDTRLTLQKYGEEIKSHSASMKKTSGDPAGTCEKPADTSEDPAGTCESPVGTNGNPVGICENPNGTCENPSRTCESPVGTCESPSKPRENPAGEISDDAKKDSGLIPDDAKKDPGLIPDDAKKDPGLAE